MAFFSNLFGNSQSAEPPPGTGCDVHVNVYDLWEHNDSVVRAAVCANLLVPEGRVGSGGMGGAGGMPRSPPRGRHL